MPQRASYQISRPSFVADPTSVIQSYGGQIDWTQVPDSYKDSAGVKQLKGGTVMIRTAQNKLAPRRVLTPTDQAQPASEILVADVREGARQDALSGVGTFLGGHFYDNLCFSNDVAGIASGIKTQLGSRFVFTTRADSAL